MFSWSSPCFIALALSTRALCAALVQLCIGRRSCKLSTALLHKPSAQAWRCIVCTVHCEHPLRKCALQISNQRPPYISAASLALTTIQPPLPGIAFRYHPKHNQMPFSQIAGHFEDLQIYRILNSLRKGLLTPQYESQITQKWTFDTTI